MNGVVQCKSVESSLFLQEGSSGYSGQRWPHILCTPHPVHLTSSLPHFLPTSHPVHLTSSQLQENLSCSENPRLEAFYLQPPRRSGSGESLQESRSLLFSKSLLKFQVLSSIRIPSQHGPGPGVLLCPCSMGTGLSGVLLVGSSESRCCAKVFWRGGSTPENYMAESSACKTHTLLPTGTLQTGGERISAEFQRGHEDLRKAIQADQQTTGLP